MAGLPHVDSCCCGLTNLKTGSVIVGILFLISSVTPGAVTFHSGGPWSIIASILVIACLVASILLIIGIIQDNATFVKVFVVVGIIALVVDIIFDLAAVLSGHLTIGSAIIAIVIQVLIVGYCVIVVNSYYGTLTGQSAVGA